jgi:hypothetical protein
MKHKLDLLENAIDSLNEALAKYEQAKAGDVKAYKFCVLHLSHFLELVLKLYVTLAHPHLIYKNPFAKQFDGESQTIGLQEAINFLRNEGRDLPDDFLSDLDWLKKLRNRIEHHKFEMDIPEVEATIGRLIRAFVEFDQVHENLGLDDSVNMKHFDLFIALADNYELNLKKAKGDVATLAHRSRDDMDFQVGECPECEHETMISSTDSKTGLKCLFCGNEEPSDDVEVRCGICDLPWPRFQMDYCDWYDQDDWIHVCPRCRHDPEYVEDD